MVLLKTKNNFLKESGVSKELCEYRPVCEQILPQENSKKCFIFKFLQQFFL